MGSEFTVRKTVLGKDGSRTQSEKRFSLKKTPSTFNGPAAAQQLLALHTAHFVVVVPSKFCSSPDPPEEGKDGV